MAGSKPSELPLVESVFHPTDFSPASADAFAHALAIALVRRASFTILHAGDAYLGEDQWTSFPPVRETLERWGVLEKGSPRSAVFDELMMTVKKVNVRGDPLKAILDYLEKRRMDLIVLATEGRDGLPRWLRRSVAETVARRTRTKTLFVPRGARGFVSAEDGSVALRRVLIPIASDPDPGAALEYASRAASAFSEGAVKVTLLHVGDAAMPAPAVPESPVCSWEMLQRSGDVVDTIAEVAGEIEPDLMFMATRGRDGVLDALRGTVTEQVLRRSPCPLVAVPME